MGKIIGIDVGGSTTKIVGFESLGEDKKILSPIYVKASDPLASVYGAFGKFTALNGIDLSDVNKVMITGVGIPGSKDCVAALNALQNSIMFKPFWPRAGPTGGDGFALPAGI